MFSLEFSEPSPLLLILLTIGFFFPVLHVDVYVLHIICVKIYPLVKLFWFVISSFRKKDVYFKDGKNEEGVGTFICILAKK